jgi:hypothetical protein
VSAFSTRFGVRTSPSRAGSSPSSSRSRLIKSCILVFYIAGSGLTAAALGQHAAEDPDALYAKRAHLPSAVKASEILAQTLAQNPHDYDAAWKLARVNYWLSSHAPSEHRKRYIRDGIEAGRTATWAEPERPEGHFWLAAIMSALAESSGIVTGMRYRMPIRQQLEHVLRIDPAFLQGSADRALGRWYYKVPGLFGGSMRHAEAHLRKALTYDADSTMTHLFLAELLLAVGRPAEARYSLNRVINAPVNPQWIPEDEEFKAKARELLKSLR